jgi:hypothetical protein
MAEREGFEPSVQLCCAKPRRVRKLQIAKNVAENCTLKMAIELCSQ